MTGYAFGEKAGWGSSGIRQFRLGMSQFSLLLVTLSVVEGSPADWLRSFDYAQDERVWARNDRI